jgi:glycolate oxidase FAD binding subunit
VLKFGGQVMKNVAGYDVSRLMTGSLGILGLISQVSLKVLPIPPAQTTLCFDWSQEEALRQVNEWSGKPLPLSATAWEHGVLRVRLAGACAAVESTVKQLGGTVMDAEAAEAWWRSLRDQTHGFFHGAGRIDERPSLWRLSLPAIAPVVTESQIPGAAHQLIEWGGAQRWLWSMAAPAAIRQFARKLGGHAVLFNNRRGATDVFDSLSEPLMAIHRRLKQTFDPHGVLNPGRLYRGL